jgi:hypothetical protein
MSTDTPTEDLVTEEMIEAAARAIREAGRQPQPTEDDIIREEAIFALRAVAPMIAARVASKLLAADWGESVGRAVAAEREACAKIVDDYFGGFAVGDHSLAGLPAAIRARGEPTS